MEKFRYVKAESEIVEINAAALVMDSGGSGVVVDPNCDEDC